MKLKNRLLMLPRHLAWRRADTVPKVPPDRIYIESTNRCNLECPQCPTGLDITHRPKGDMDPGLFRNIIDEIAPWAETAVLHIWGEPLLNPNLDEMIAYAAGAGLRTEISSNAMLLDAERAERLIRTGLSRIFLCIDGVDEATYNQIRVGGDFRLVKANIEQFIRMNLQAPSPVEVWVQLIRIDLTRKQVDAFRKEWSRPGVKEINIKAFDSWGGRVASINEMNKEGESAAIPAQRHPCPNLWYHAHIFCDGSLVCCDRDFDVSTPLGNVKDGVLETWRGEKMQALRKAHGTGIIETTPCQECKEWAWWKPGLFSSWGNAPKKQ
jgi:organic radical activating enzyme